MRQLPRLVARDAAVVAGHTVVIEVTGPGPAVTARQGVMVEVDGDGRLRGHALTDLSAARPADQPQQPTTTISLSTEAFTRRAAGRRSVSDTAYRVVGDDALARRVVQALVVTH